MISQVRINHRFQKQPHMNLRYLLRAVLTLTPGFVLGSRVGLWGSRNPEQGIVVSCKKIKQTFNHDAIQSSPHATPAKLNNPVTCGFSRYLRGYKKSSITRLDFTFYAPHHTALKNWTVMIPVMNGLLTTLNFIWAFQVDDYKAFALTLKMMFIGSWELGNSYINHDYFC